MLHVAFVWHMHQPSYRDPVTGEIALPWVRLHGVKDYTDMALALAAVPGSRTTVNWVPGLLDQFEAVQSPDYGRRERFWRLTQRPADELTASEVQLIREHFFSLSPRTMLEPHARYRELRDKVREDRLLTAGELRDLQIWFNLAWMGVGASADPRAQALLEKGRDFAEEDKRPLLELHRETVAAIVPRWRKLADDGLVELTASPYYHPILPLLCDTDLARVADPSSPLPASRFRWRGDANAQIRLAVDAHARRFGAKPTGMWPSEGSVTAEILPLVRAAGIKWLATDEAILWKTLTGDAAYSATRATDKFRPWSLDGVTLVFRDHGLSDKIGFVYASWPYERAYADFVQSLVAIERATAQQGDAVVTIALDGENCWEQYPGGITAFLPGLLRAIAETPNLRLSTVSEALAAVPAQPLPGLGTGSWIDGTFRTWLGDPVKNLAWELLTAARQAVKRPMDELLTQDPGLAELVMRAEASDWWWWFGEGHSSQFDGDFDALFRAHLKAIWLALGLPVPEVLNKSVYALAASTSPQAKATTQRTKRPMTQLVVTVDGSAGWYFKWLGAGEIQQSFGAIHRADSLFSRVLYGNDDDAMYLRIDTRDHARDALADAVVTLTIEGHTPKTFTLWPAPAASSDPATPAITAACDEILEARVPFTTLEVHSLPARLRGYIALSSKDSVAPAEPGVEPESTYPSTVLERFPGMGDLELELISALDSALNTGV